MVNKRFFVVLSRGTPLSDYVTSMTPMFDGCSRVSVCLNPFNRHSNTVPSAVNLCCTKTGTCSKATDGFTHRWIETVHTHPAQFILRYASWFARIPVGRCLPVNLFLQMSCSTQEEMWEKWNFDPFKETRSSSLQMEAVTSVTVRWFPFNRKMCSLVSSLVCVKDWDYVRFLSECCTKAGRELAYYCRLGQQAERASFASLPRMWKGDLLSCVNNLNLLNEQVALEPAILQKWKFHNFSFISTWRTLQICWIQREDGSQADLHLGDILLTSKL